MNWAKRLKRAFKIDMEICEKCGGKSKPIASIEDPDVINKILKSLNLLHPPNNQISFPISRSPPVGNVVLLKNKKIKKFLAQTEALGGFCFVNESSAEDGHKRFV